MAINFVAFLLFFDDENNCQAKSWRRERKGATIKGIFSSFLSELQKCLKKQEGARRREKEVHLKGNKK